MQRTSISTTATTATTAIPALPGGTRTITGYVGSAPLLFGVIELLVECDVLAFVEGLEAFCVDCREVHEDILAAVLRSDKAEALIAEEFYGAVLSHFGGVMKILCGGGGGRGSSHGAHATIIARAKCFLFFRWTGDQVCTPCVYVLIPLRIVESWITDMRCTTTDNSVSL